MGGFSCDQAAGNGAEANRPRGWTGIFVRGDVGSLQGAVHEVSHDCILGDMQGHWRAQAPAPNSLLTRLIRYQGTARQRWLLSAQRWPNLCIVQPHAGGGTPVRPIVRLDTTCSQVPPREPLHSVQLPAQFGTR